MLTRPVVLRAVTASRSRRQTVVISRSHPLIWPMMPERSVFMLSRVQGAALNLPCGRAIDLGSRVKNRWLVAELLAANSQVFGRVCEKPAEFVCM